MRYLIDRTRMAVWAWRNAAALFYATSELRQQQTAPHDLLDDNDYLGSMPIVRDNCQTCDGTRGVRGNENIVRGVTLCDYCHAEGKP